MTSELRWTLPEVMEQWSVEQPDVENFLFVDKNGEQSRWTARDLFVTASRFAGQLRHTYGYREGDILANALLNSPERLITDLGAMLAGCVVVNCQIVEKDGSDFWNTARLSTCKTVILPARADNAAAKLFTPFVPNLLQTSGSVDVSIPQAPDLKNLLVIQRDPSNPSSSLLESLKSENCQTYCSTVNTTDLAFLFATSGSSGFCKLVPRTQEEILKTGRSFEAAKSIKYFNDRPFGWMGGFPFDYLAHCGVRILQDQFDNLHAQNAIELWKVIAREKCTGAALLPSQISAMMAHFKDNPPEFKLGFLVTGGQPLRQNLADTLGVMTHALVVSYGSTESGMVSFGAVTDPAKVKDFLSGQVNKNFSIKIVDQTTGEDVEPGTRGDVLLKSSLNFRGYFNQPEIPTEEIFTKDGWYKSGDIGMLDKDGNFFCFTRSGDSVSQGSIVVFCSWPESVLSKCPGVQEAAVIKLPGSDEEGALCACVVAQEGSGLTEESLLKAYKNSFMAGEGAEASYIPELSKVVFLDSLPLLDSGKISKRLLKSRVLDKLGL